MEWRMSEDPAGLYARLDVDPAAPPEAIAAAFRRMARVLHPDVVETGDAEAFIRVKEAYDVLGDVDRRAAYDRNAHAAAATEPVVTSAATEPVTRFPRLSDLPVALWGGLGSLACLAAVMAMVQFARSPPPSAPPVARPFAPSVPAATTPARAPAAAAMPTGGSATHFVVPASGAAVLWRHDAVRDVYLPGGQLDAFSPVQAVGLVPQHGLVEIRLADGSSGFVDAARLAPGDGMAAHRAYCAYNAGPSPQNGELLDRHGVGTEQLRIANRSVQPAVVKLRDASGRATVTVFVAPGSSTLVAELPDGSYRPEFAIGELWSRACHDFAAGMRAQRFDSYASLSALSPLVIPPDLSVAPAPVDIPDAAFERE
jgi:DnaJ domain